MKIMGILNATPDSFSDGGLFNSAPQAIQRIDDLIGEGAAIVDIGAESTRPGSDPVDSDKEWQRLEPILTSLGPRHKHISLDTRHDATALRAFDMGVRFFNNISGLYSEPTMKRLAQDPKTRYCAMHSSGQIQSLHRSPLEKNQALKEVTAFFAQTYKKLLSYGFRSENCYLDPGIGFGKTDAANIALIQNSHRFSDCYNLLCGISRKSFMGRLFNVDSPNERDMLSKAFEIALIEQNVQIIRTHNVKLLTDILGKLNGGTI